MTTFQGLTPGAFEFYEELQDNNNREWWQEHKNSYQSLVREPLALLLAELEPQFGPPKLFRANRDIRFSEDKSPYKTAQGGVASAQEGVGYYLQISADGLLVGGGYHSRTPAQLARYRNSVDASGTGESLRHILEAVTAAGFAVEGEKLKTVPRGYARDHPRAELLKHKSLSAGVNLGRPDWLGTPAAVQHLADLWEDLRPLVDWVSRHAAP
ncbi:DUF2461 domain-containing protein [Pseudarthrobacter sp. NamB4]|uniref:DUF2461 domain-containing protein n=1 Tax=Pseudarthrobacter sp. NamB4 TaxID=2576837 RepID=UPI0010FDEA5A|nr:DUF2461 domain-containing protein [Pseudarthrobacter sp. NamB4]TLM74601.1 DUF2461 domain-containing protein [Pseudarthrobacter sp. NamB4]